MSIWDEVRGQDIAIDLLRRSVQRERLAHGYAFHGPPGSGRKLVARKLAQSLFCPEVPDEALDACGTCPSCKQIAAGSHPDLLEVKKPADKKSIPIDLLIGDREKRGREGLCYELAMRPLAADRRIAIIDDADALAVDGANALLKTLEEPPAGALLILIAESPESLLPTIRSRCQPLHFAPLPDEALIDLLISQGHDAGDAAAVAPLAGGSLETAAQLLDPGLRQVRDDVRAAMTATPFHPLQASERTIKAIETLADDATEKRAITQLTLRFLMDLLRDAMRYAAIGDGPRDAAALVNSLQGDEAARLETIGRLIDRVRMAEAATAMMMPLPLCMEGLFDELAVLRRGAERTMIELPVWN